jgi:hypothetical protein
MPLAMVIMAVGQSECPLLASCRLTATGQSLVLHFLGGVAKAICIFEPIAVLIALVAENQGTTEHSEHTEAGNVGTTEHTEARDNRLRVVFRGRVEGNWYLSNHHKTLGKRPKVRFLSSPLKNPGFPRFFRILGQFLWPSVAPMQLGAWRLRRCISRRAPQIESFFASRELPKYRGGCIAPEDRIRGS